MVTSLAELFKRFWDWIRRSRSRTTIKIRGEGFTEVIIEHEP